MRMKSTASQKGGTQAIMNQEQDVEPRPRQRKDYYRMALLNCFHKLHRFHIVSDDEEASYDVENLEDESGEEGTEDDWSDESNESDDEDEDEDYWRSDYPSP